MGTKVPNWNEIRTEYINGDTSYRKIAAKYGVSYHMLKNRATKEHWYADKVAQHEEIRAKTAQKTAEMLAERNAESAKKLTNATIELINKICEAINQANVFPKKIKKKIPYKVVDQTTGENYVAWREEESTEFETKKEINVEALVKLSSALRSVQTAQIGLSSGGYNEPEAEDDPVSQSLKELAEDMNKGVVNSGKRKE